MGFSENLFNNLIVIFVLLALFIIVYCKIKNQTLLDIFRDLREAMAPPEFE